jgi:penicillin G amidase
VPFIIVTMGNMTAAGPKNHRIRCLIRLPVAIAALASALLLLPGAASARVVQAVTILPPGQSGVVDDPHVFDQLPLFQRLEYKPEPLGGGPGGTAPERPRPGVTIRRDGFGVPAISARTDADAWWGAGYAVAQDRLGEMELFKRRGSGRLAEILGKSSLEDDIVARRDFYTPAELRRQFRRLPRRFRKRTLAYVAGVNAWIAHVRRTPADLPAEFSALKVPLRRWGLLDTIRIGVLLARTIPSGDGNELDNLRALRALGPKRFAELLPLSVPGEITSIPRNAGTFPSVPGRTPAEARAAYGRSRTWLKRLALPSASSARAAGVPTGKERPAHAIDVALGRVHGSFMWAIRRRSDRHTFFFNGPQLGYQAPNTFVELDLKAPGMRLHTGTAPGVPVNSNGYNAHMAWGVTSGLSDDDDLFAVRLAGPERYRFRGRVRRMRCRTERFRFTESGTMKSTKRRLCRTVHGPVQERAGGWAFARRYAIWGREVETLEGLAQLAAARDLRGADRALRKVTWTENILAADDRGHIGYWHPGLYQLRDPRWDERLPLPGDGRAEWRGLLPRSRDPHVIDPPGRNWLVNWNNVPAKGWTSGDAPAREQLNGPYHRVAMLAGLVQQAAADPSSFDRATIGVIRDMSRIATQRPTAQAALQGAAAGATGPAADVLNTLLAWDGDYTRTGPDGKVEPGVATWEAFKAAAQVVALGEPTPDTRALVGTPGDEGFVESTLGETYALRTLDAEGYRRAAANAAAALTARFGSADPATWRDERAMVSPEVQGLAIPPPIPLQNRGTFELAVELGR